jgi:hypothetical protein
VKLRCLVLLILSACASAQSLPPAAARSSVPSSQPTAAGSTRLISLQELHASSGALTPLAAGAIGIRSECLRAELAPSSRARLELTFRYLGPSRATAPLASGELRRQIGLKLRAQDTCNVVYVMWQIAPAPRLEVSVKHNPDAHTHEQCRDHGYTFVKPSWQNERAQHPLIELDQPHRLAATLQGRTLEISLDDAAAWRGELPATALAFDGPGGIRSDNGDFDVELRELP